MTLQLLTISLPVFLIIAVGWFFRQKKIVSEEHIKVLNNFAYYVSLPAIIIAGFWGANFQNGEVWQTIAISFAVSLGFSAIVFILLSLIKMRKRKKATIFLAATIGNTVYMGLPILESAFGKNDYAVVASSALLVVPILISIFVVKLWHDKEIKVSEQLKDLIKNPLFISFIFGILIGILNLSGGVFDGIHKTFTMLGATASPVALFALGAFLKNRFLKEDIWESIFASILKIIAFPIIGFFLMGDFLGKTGGTFALLLAMPVAVTTFVLAEKYELDKDIVGNAILISTVISLVIAPIIVSFF